jgi:hypothetical protein
MRSRYFRLATLGRHIMTPMSAFAAAAIASMASDTTCQIGGRGFCLACGKTASFTSSPEAGSVNSGSFTEWARSALKPGAGN